MWEQFFHYVRPFTRVTQTMDRQQWVAAVVAILVLGLICMRGFGSRSGY